MTADLQPAQEPGGPIAAAEQRLADAMYAQRRAAEDHAEAAPAAQRDLDDLLRELNTPR